MREIAREICRKQIVATARFTRSVRLCAAIFLSLSSIASPSGQETDSVSPWDWSLQVRGGAGHKDNVLLSDFNKESSAFTFTEAEFFLYRAAVDSWEFNSFFSLEDRRLWQSPSVDREQLALASLEAKKKLWEISKVGLNLQYFYNYQVFDASVTEGLPFRILARMHRASATPSWQVDLPGKRRIEATFSVARNLLEAPLDDAWEWGPRLLFGQKFGYGSDLTLFSGWRRRAYDTRLASGTTDQLSYDIWETEASLKYVWDEKKHWRSRFRVGAELNLDNGDGFYDYDKYRLANELSFTSGNFEGILQAKFLYYEYPRQFAANGNGRRRAEVIFGGRLKQAIMKRLNLFVQAEHEWVLATDFLERYRATTVWGGIEWDIK
jgi:hypothetical protein